MSVFITGPARVTLRGLLVPLAMVASFTVALGLVWVARVLADALFGIVGGTVGWIPWLGGKAKGSLDAIAQRVSNKLGEVAAGLSARIGHALHDAGVAVYQLGQTIYHSALIEGWLVRKIEDARAGYDELYRRVRGLPAQKATTTKVVKRVQVIEREVTYPGAGRIGRVVRKQTAPLARRVGRLERQVQTPAAAVAQSAAITLPGQIGDLRARSRRQGRSLERLWARLRRLEKPAAATLGVAALLQALIRARLGWLRCRNVRKAGRGVCRMDPSTLDELLAGMATLVGVVSLVELTEATQGIVGELEQGLKILLREL